ncbi:MAG: NADH dehydrogenase (quinone) subunit D [Chloroflexi bacterium]|nr:NADH dehydrogenase (quinone) subunit D [Chloroflexota bacterium]
MGQSFGAVSGITDVDGPTSVSTWEGNVDELRGLVSERAFTGETMLLNMGPHHPSTHGVLRVLLELDGEEIVSCLPDVGYLHTGIEKTIEAKTYEKGIPLTDRTDYLAPMSNNMVYSMAIEKLVDLDVPYKAQIMRIIGLELTRINSHLVWLGTHALDLGAMSVFLYCFREREYILEMFEIISGQRMMTSYIRPGGVWRDFPPEFLPKLQAFLDFFPRRIDDYENLLTGNPLWIERTQGVGILEPDKALAWGCTGPTLRGSGVNWDLRKAVPYSSYEEFDFDVPVGEHGDVYDRFYCRILEMRESVKILQQAIKKLPAKGPYRSENRKYVMPPRSELGQSMEAVIHHFKLWTEGFATPDKDVYVAIESPRGELGCYVHGTGGNKPRRVHLRTPSFVHISALPVMSEGHLIADLVAIIGSIDIVLGDCDR